MNQAFIKTLLLAASVCCVLVAAFVSWHLRASRTPLQPRSGAANWWRGEPRPVNPKIGAGWLAFVLLNGFFAITQPLLAAGLFVRAYVLRAIFLRKGR
jgi:hypothetical protein